MSRTRRKSKQPIFRDSDDRRPLMDGDARMLKGGMGECWEARWMSGVLLSQELSWKLEGFITGQLKSSRLTSFLPPYEMQRGGGGSCNIAVLRHASLLPPPDSSIPHPHCVA